MAENPFIRRQFKDNVSVTTSLAGSLSPTGLSFSLNLGQGASYPDGSVGPFTVTIDQGTASEERIQCVSRSSDSFSINPTNGRGYGTSYTGVLHNSGASCLHTMTRQDLDEANQVVVQTLGQIAAKGDLLVGSAANTLTKLTAGANGTLLQVISGGLQWSAAGVGLSTQVQATAADGTSTAWSRADHVHSGLGLPLSLTGATTATRFAGGVSGAAPGSGTFNLGDAVVDNTGQLWICTTAGSPGTWKQAGPVASFNTRTGAVVPAVGDYLAVPTGGLTGATAATRFVGGTASGAPASGTFAVGDLVVDQTGTLWVCTTAGTPGTFGRVGPVNNPSGGMHSTSTTTINNGATTLLGSMTSDFQKGGCAFVSANNAISVPVAGEYQVNAALGSANAGSNAVPAGAVFIQLLKNGTKLDQASWTGASGGLGYPSTEISQIYTLAASDQLSINAGNLTGAAIFVDPTNGNQVPPRLTVSLVSQ